METSLRKPFLGLKALASLLKTDPSARSLFFSNLLVIGIALYEKWPLQTTLYIYVWQSVIIGFFNVLRILWADVTVQGQKPDTTTAAKAKYFLACFFAFHYGFFQYGYFHFIGKPSPGEWGWIGICLFLFFLHHLFSFSCHLRQKAPSSDMARLMFFPYLRIIPMHLTIIFGSFLMLVFRNPLMEQVILVSFLLLKTDADLKMHQVEHETDMIKVPGSRDILPQK